MEALEPRALLSSYLVTTTADSVPGSLRDAIAQANANAGADVIQFDPSILGQTISLAAGQLPITDALTINGPGSASLTIDAGVASNIFAISNTTATIQGLQLINGFATQGGAIIATNSSLTLNAMVFSANHATTGGGGVFSTGGSLTINASTFLQNALGFAPSSGGGAIFMAGGLLTMADTTLSQNTDGFTAADGGGAILLSADPGTALTAARCTFVNNSSIIGGGAIRALAGSTMTLTDCTLSNNSIATPGGDGGAIKSTGAVLTLLRATISANAASTGGALLASGGVLLMTDSTLNGNHAQNGGTIGAMAGAVVTVTNCVITHGDAANDGGAVYGDTATLNLNASTISLGLATRGAGISWHAGTLNVSGSLFTSNQAANGGGIASLQSVTTIVNSTFASNVASTDGSGVFSDLGNVLIANSTIANNAGMFGVWCGGPMTLVSTIVSGNAGGDVGGTALNSASNHNLVHDAANAGQLVNGANANQVGVDPLLGSLVNNGGGTLSFALQTGSPAINAGANPQNLTTDQRGATFARVRGNAVDIGAYEFSAAPGVTSLTPSAPSLTRPAGLILTASVSDADGTVARVDFYRDVNNNGVAESGELIGTDSNSSDGFAFTLASTQGLPSGDVRFLAVATDQDALASTPGSATVAIGNFPPLIDALNSDALSIFRGQAFTLVATGASDPDGVLSRVDFYRDVNNDGIADPSELIGPDLDAVGGYTFTITSTLTLPVGALHLLAVAVDSDGVASAPKALTLSVLNNPPVVRLLGHQPQDAFVQGDTVTISSFGETDADGFVVSVSYYVDRNGNNIGEPDELVGVDSDGHDGFSYTLTREQSEHLPVDVVNIVAVATDDLGERSASANDGLFVLFNQHAGTGSLASGTADNTDTHRVLSRNPGGHLIVFDQGWDVVDLQQKTLAPVTTGDGVIYVDPKDNLTYVAAPTASGILLFKRNIIGGWSYVTLSAVAGASASPTHGLTSFASVGGIVVIAGLTDDGSIVAFQQVLPAAEGESVAWKFVDISGDLTSQGMTTPALSSLVSYVPAWDSWHLAGIDGNGRIQSVWISLPTPGFTKWRTDDLTAVTGAPSVQGQLAVTLTSWGGINLTGLGSDGHVLTTWWVPSFGATWQANDLTTQFGGSPLSSAGISGFTTPWGGLNYVGLASDGSVTVYWWAPGASDWQVSPLVAGADSDAHKPVGTLTSSSSPAGTLSVYATSSTGDVLRMWWKPNGAAAWATEDLTELAVRA